MKHACRILAMLGASTPFPRVVPYRSVFDELIDDAIKLAAVFGRPQSSERPATVSVAAPVARSGADD